MPFEKRIRLEIMELKNTTIKTVPLWVVYRVGMTRVEPPTIRECDKDNNRN